MAEKEKYLSESLIKDKPIKALGLQIKEGAITTSKIANQAVTTEKLAEDLKGKLTATEYLDEKYTNITNELYSMIQSLQVSGVALSNQLGDREDIGISQKALTKIIGEIWEAIQDPSHKVFNFTLTANPEFSYADAPVDVTITADSSMAISDFDNIKIYIDDELTAESSDISVYTIHRDITQNSVIKAVGMILGKTITKELTVHVEVPFFMGSGLVYTNIINEKCRKELIGTLEGDYDTVVKNTNDYIFIIIPKSRKEEFRRADMNGYEIPLTIIEETQDYVVYKSINKYNAGTYNIDININT